MFSWRTLFSAIVLVLSVSAAHAQPQPNPQAQHTSTDVLAMEKQAHLLRWQIQSLQVQHTRYGTDTPIGMLVGGVGVAAYAGYLYGLSSSDDTLLCYISPGCSLVEKANLRTELVFIGAAAVGVSLAGAVLLRSRLNTRRMLLAKIDQKRGELQALESRIQAAPLIGPQSALGASLAFTF